MNQSKKKPTVSSLLSVIGNLKSEHQRYVFKLNKQNEKLQDELSVLRKKSTEDDDTIQCLRDENQTLLLRLKQFESEQNFKDIYEIDEILGDKIISKKKYYLVKWEGFDEEHNSWEPKSHLNCKEALREYEQSKRKKKM